MQNGIRCMGAAVVDGTRTLWTRALPPGTSAQRAELITLIEALRLGAGKAANIYTDSRYAFATAHVHGAIYQERGLLTAEGKTIKNKQEILDLLAAIWLPTKVAIIHCPGHQKGHSPEAVGNRMADQEARKVALHPPMVATFSMPSPVLPEKPVYSKEDQTYILKLLNTSSNRGWTFSWDGCLCCPLFRSNSDKATT